MTAFFKHRVDFVATDFYTRIAGRIAAGEAPMKTVVIGGHTQNIGKTSTIASLIRHLIPPGWSSPVTV